jgi:hypothetical protein
MRTVALAIVVVLLMTNVALYPYWTAEKEEDDFTVVDDDDDDIVQIDAISVTVPPVRSGDVLQYDYEFFAEMYEKNTTSGNWSRITLEANGQLREDITGPLNQKDGFGVAHESWKLHIDMALTVKITIIEYNPGEESEPLIVNGRIDVGRDRYATMSGDIPILNYAGGLLAIDEVKGLDIPVTNFEFEVDNWGYPDPHVVPERTLEENLYGEGNTLTEGDNGTYGEYDEAWNYTQWYNWSIDTSERIRGYDCARLNISLDFFGFITLDKLLWLSSNVPRPVRTMYNSTTMWFEPNSTGHLILLIDQTLTKNGYSRGSSPLPVNREAVESFVDRAPAGDFREWQYAPEDGSISSSSFDLGLKEAVNVALEESSGLQDWMRTHPSPFITEASYWANQTDIRTMEYTWNITFGDEMGDPEAWEDWGPTNAYYVNVTKSVTTRVIGGDEVETFIASEHGAWWGWTDMREDVIRDELLTLASSEDIWAAVSRVSDVAYSGFEDEVDFTNGWYSFSMGGLDFAGGFGMDLLDTLAGITIPNAEVSWVMQVGSVWEGAATTVVAVDAETGRMVYVTQISGPQSLMLIFGAGG